MIRIGRTGFKFPGRVPPLRRIVLGMDQQAANAGDVGGLSRTQQRILQQSLTETLALMRLVYCEPSQDHHGYRAARQPFHHSGGRRLRIDAAEREAVESHHLVALAANVCLYAVSFLADERVTLQELVKRGIPTIEGVRLIQRC